jgi:signal transduction histidine kinase
MTRPGHPAGHRLLIVFAATILAPGLALAFVGARSAWQERQRAEEQLTARLEHSAQVAARSLTAQLARLQDALDQTPWSDRRLGRPADGSWALVVRDNGLRVHPAGLFPFELEAAPPVPPDSPATPEQVTHHQARALKHAGRIDDAARLWRTIAAGGGRIGAVPADLIAAHELAQLDAAAAQRFYDQLTSGHWRIDKARYLAYSNAVAARVKTDARHEATLRLAEALEAVMGGARVVSSGGGVHVGFRAEAPFRALVVSDRFLASQVPPAADAEMRVARITADGRPIYGEATKSPDTHRATREMDIAGIRWSVDVEPKDAAAFVAVIVQRSNLYLSMLALVLALLASGGYLIARTVRQEIEVARLKSDFVSTVSHEFRSPLTGIRQLAEMLSRDRVADDTKRHEYFGLILRESERLGRLVESLLDFSRMEAGRRQYQFQPLETAAWLREVAKEFEPEAARAGYAFEASIPSQLPGVSGDRDALSLAIRNLLDNAMKYSPESKTVWLEAHAVGDRVRIRVRDRGVGIPARLQGHIFEKFYRVSGEPTKTVKGVGLGLSLVRHIVESHNGTISVESSEGAGSTFAIELMGAA